jgi:hypothetical protein
VQGKVKESLIKGLSTLLRKRNEEEIREIVLKRIIFCFDYFL